MSNNELAKLRTGDLCWRANSVRKSVFLCEVVDVGNFSIGVVEKDRPNSRVLWFDRETGRPVGWIDSGPAPQLLTHDDPDAVAIAASVPEIDRAHARYRRKMQDHISKLPGTPAEWDAVYDTLDAWEAMSQKAVETQKSQETSGAV